MTTPAVSHTLHTLQFAADDVPLGCGGEPAACEGAPLTHELAGHGEAAAAAAQATVQHAPPVGQEAAQEQQAPEKLHAFAVRGGSGDPRSQAGVPGGRP